MMTVPPLRAYVAAVRNRLPLIFSDTTFCSTPSRLYTFESVPTGCISLPSEHISTRMPKISFPRFSERTLDAQSAAQRQRLHVRRLCDAGGVRARMDLRTVAHAVDTCHHLRGRRGLHEAGAGWIVDTVHSTGTFDPVPFPSILDFLRLIRRLLSPLYLSELRAYLIVLPTTPGRPFPSV
jgi:hypothetical protein